MTQKKGTRRTNRRTITINRKPRGRRTQRPTPFQLPHGIETKIGLDADLVYAARPGMVRLAHFTYRITGKQRRLRSVDYFIPSGAKLAATPAKYPVDLVLEVKAGVRYTIPQVFAQATDLIRGIVAAHVRAHLGDRYRPNAQPDLETSIAHVAMVSPLAPIRTRPAKLRSGSKQAGKRSCRLHSEIEISRGCYAALTKDGYANPCLGCRQCYRYSYAVGAHVIYTVDSEQLRRQHQRLCAVRRARGKKTDTCCVGVIADPGHLWYRPELIETLTFCSAGGITPIVRSKFLEYGPVVSNLLKQSDGVLVVSLGSDALELGAVAHGRTQKVRIRDGLCYLRDGVNVVAGVLIDPAQVDGGELLSPALQLALAKFPSVILYALRAKTTAIAELVFGADFKAKKTPTGAPMYERHGGEWVASYVHPTIVRLIGDNRGAVRLCLKSTAGEYCGACFIPGEAGSAIGAAPSTVLAPLANTRPRDVQRGAGGKGGAA